MDGDRNIIHATAEKVCNGCGDIIVRRPNEKFGNYKRRVTCGKYDCKYKSIKRKPTFIAVPKLDPYKEYEELPNWVDFSKHEIKENPNRTVFKGAKPSTFVRTKSTLSDM